MILILIEGVSFNILIRIDQILSFLYEFQQAGSQTRFFVRNSNTLNYERRRGLVGKTVALATEGRRFESTVW